MMALDRSGSMAASAGPELTKMDLANRAAIEAMRLLGDQDEVGVLAVDTRAETVLPLQPAAQGRGQTGRVAAVRSSGGGIYVEEALSASYDALSASRAGTRHTVLFADANDAEGKGVSLELAGRMLRELGLTTSVVALGREGDRDSAFLRELAAAGGGQAWFTADPASLPRLFSMDTIAVAGSSFVEGPVGQRPLEAGLVRLGELPTTWPRIGGYNLGYDRPEATVALRSADEYAAPLLAAWNRGLGRVLTYCGEVEGPDTGELGTWTEYAPAFATAMRWVLGGAAPATWAGRVDRRGRDVRVEVEFDPERGAEPPPEAPTLRVIPARAGAETETHRFRWEGPQLLRARFRLADGAPRLLRVRAGERVLFLPPVQVPVPPEYEPRFGRTPGADVLAELSRISGGRERLDLGGLYAQERPERRARSLRGLFLAALLGLALLEIAGRRLGLGTVDRGLRGWVRGRRAPRASGPGASPPRGPLPEKGAPRAGSEGLREDPLEALVKARARADARLQRGGAGRPEPDEGRPREDPQA
jgi:hypothetical protein